MAARILTGVALALWMSLGLAAPAVADDVAFDRLVAAYPDALAGHDGAMLIWKDGTRTPLAEGPADKPFEEKLRAASLADQMSLPYAAGPLAGPPGENMDPGRFRNIAFFDKVYGDCMAGGFEKRLVTIRWLPKSSGKSLRVNAANGAAKALEAISAEIERLPADLRTYAYPSAGTYNCRVVKDTGVKSAHAYGIAIDLNTEYADYWLWAKGSKARPAYRNRMPQEIVEIFERHGYIWGGKWSHFDTMHFEYRPELLSAGPAAGVAVPLVVKDAVADAPAPAPARAAKSAGRRPPSLPDAASPGARPGVAGDCAGRQPGLLGCGVGFGSMSGTKIDP